MIVVIVNPRKGKYYGGAVAAPVFRELSDRLYAIRPDIMIPLPHDSSSSLFPFAQSGNMKDTEDAFTFLGMPVSHDGSISAWGQPVASGGKLVLTSTPISRGTMPDVCGMGLKDALFLLESRGLNVIVNGRGTVVRQSLNPGLRVYKGMPVVIELQLKQDKPKTQA